MNDRPRRSRVQGLPAASPFELTTAEAAEWQAALAHQCIPQVTAHEAHEAVTAAWHRAITAADA